VGIQDMGAAGLTSSSFEMASRSGSGIEMDLDRVPVRETGMSAYEIMLSESQERMLLVAKRGCEEKVSEIFQKWDLDAVVVGTVTDDGWMRLKKEGRVVAELPIAPLVDAAPIYDRPATPPSDIKERQSLDTSQLNFSKDWNQDLKDMLGSPNLCSRHWVYRQYDHMVMTNTVVLPGGDGAVMRLKGLKQGVAVTSDCNSRYCYLDPYLGAAHAVAEAARNLACTGAKPLAITDCLNFGNPEKPEIMWEFKEAIRGLGEACRVLDTPVVSGNVSLYNDTMGTSIFPTPTVGMVGVLSDVEKHGTAFFKQAGDVVFLIGDLSGTLGGSEYLSHLHGKVAGNPPPLDLNQEKGLHKFLLRAWQEGLLQSAHDISDGGLAVAVAESCLIGPQGPLGVELRLEDPQDAAAIAGLLFGEGASRVLISVSTDKIKTLQDLTVASGLVLHPLGSVEGRRFSLNPWIDLPIEELKDLWETSFAKIVSKKIA